MLRVGKGKIGIVMSGGHLGIRDLEKAFPHYVWKEGHSGMVVSDSLGTKLEWLRGDFLYSTFAVGKSVRKNFHCVCANCKKIFNDLCSDTYGGDLLTFGSLKKLKL